MDVDAILRELQASPQYAGQIVHLRTEPARAARWAECAASLSGPAARALRARGIARLYCHQAAAIDHLRAGRNCVVATGTASGKSLCYQVPAIEALATDAQVRLLLVFPTKALCQDQFRSFRGMLADAGLGDVSAGVYDGDTPAATRRKLRDQAAVIFTNPDMLHAALLPEHGRWAAFLSRLELLVLDELHVYSGIFGANMANLLRRLWRVCEQYRSAPRVAACSATIANPRRLAEGLTGKPFELVAEDGSPRGRRSWVFWNPPRIRGGDWRSRRSANVEAHELMSGLLARGAGVITFSKAKMTAEMIHRYVCEGLAREAAGPVADQVTCYRGGYRPEDRRAIERRLFAGELRGVSATRALELGIDVGALDASILVGYPGTLASFFQQAGRAGRREGDSLVVLVGLDTPANQYVMGHPEYVFGPDPDAPPDQAARRGPEAVLDADNPFVIVNHVRSATHELPLPTDDTDAFGPWTPTALEVLEENRKVRRIDATWYHAATETPQHEFSLRDTVDANVLIEDAGSGEVLGEVNKLDAPPILHPGAIYMHRGDTYRVLRLDLQKNVATVRREEVDYYTQPLGGTDVHHIDHRLREKPFGTATACWGEVTAYFRTVMYEKVHFYSLDAISRHPLDLPTFVLETMAVWLVPPESLMEQVRAEGLDAHAGLRGIGYAARMLLPLFVTCDTLDFSHSVGSANSPWNAIFIYERYPHGLGFTERAYHRLHEILPAVLDTVRRCPCEDGCPCCVGKPLRQYTTWNPERGEGNIPSKAPAIRILDGVLGDGSGLVQAERDALSDDPTAVRNRLRRALRRRLERAREPDVFHAIQARVETAYAPPEAPATLDRADSDRRSERRRDFGRKLRKRLGKSLGPDGLPADAARVAPPAGMRTRRGTRKPGDFPVLSGGGRTEASESGPGGEYDGNGQAPGHDGKHPRGEEMTPNRSEEARGIELGDSLAARARRRSKNKPPDDDAPPADVDTNATR